MSKFQLVLSAVFGVCILAGVLIFSLGRTGGKNAVSSVYVWGFVPQEVFKGMLEEVGLDKDETLKITYERKDKDTFDSDFVIAIADGVAPDLVFVDQSNIIKQGDRVIEIPYSSYPQRNFRNNFIDGADVFLTDTGIKAIPVAVDPLILYWNRDIFTKEGKISPPQNWASYTAELAELFTKKDGLINVIQTALPFGTWDNLSNAKGIISALIFEGGGKVTDRTAKGEIVSSLLSGGTTGIVPAEAALNFFVDFSNPQKNVYTWNRSLPSSSDYFNAGLAATYIGYSSEIETVKATNPNLNFDVSTLPQSVGGTKVTYSKVDALAISKTVRNIGGATKVLFALVTPPAVKVYNDETNTAPALRSMLLAPDNSDLYEPLIYSSAVISRTWLDPDKAKTDKIFADMINSVISGRKRVSESVRTANDELGAILEK